jgi:hypothetical protein
MEAVRGPVFASALNGESEEKPQDAEMTQATASTIEGDQTNNN